MKKNKKGRLADAVGDIIAELILSAVFIGIGACLLKLLGHEFDWEQVDPDLFALVGIVTIVAVVFLLALVWCTLSYLKRKKK